MEGASIRGMLAKIRLVDGSQEVVFYYVLEGLVNICSF